MKREAEPKHQSEQPVEWGARDDLFRVFVSELFEGNLSAKEIEATRRKKFDGVELPRTVAIGILGKLMRHRVTPEKQLAKQESLLSQIDEDEKQVVEITLGLNACGIALNRSAAASQLNLDVEVVDNFIKSATVKLTPPQAQK